MRFFESAFLLAGSLAFLTGVSSNTLQVVGKDGVLKGVPAEKVGYESGTPEKAIVKMDARSLVPTQVAVGRLNVVNKLTNDFNDAKKDYERRRYLALYLIDQGFDPSTSHFNGKSTASVESVVQAISSWSLKNLDRYIGKTVSIDEIVENGKAQHTARYLAAAYDIQIRQNVDSSEFQELFSDYIKRNSSLNKVFPGVIDPDGIVHITDGHHRALELWLANANTERVRMKLQPLVPFTVLVEITKNYAYQDGQDKKGDQWKKFLVQLCQDHQLYFDPDTRWKISHDLVNCANSSGCTVDRVLKEHYDAKVPVSFGKIRHSTMRSIIGFGLPNATWDKRKVFVRLPNDAFKDYFEFYLGEILQQKGFHFPKVIRFEKPEVGNAGFADLLHYAVTLMTIAEMRDMLMTNPVVETQILSLAKPNQANCGVPGSDEKRNCAEVARIVYDSAKKEYEKSKLEAQNDSSALDAFIFFGLECHRNSLRDISMMIDDSANEEFLRQALAKFGIEQLSQTGTCLNPYSGEKRRLIEKLLPPPKTFVSLMSKGPNHLDQVHRLIAALEKGITPKMLCGGN